MEFIQLIDGPILPSPAIILACDLEANGFTMRCEKDKLRVTCVGKTLSTAEQALIRAFRDHLLAIVEYCDRGE